MTKLKPVKPVNQRVSIPDIRFTNNEVQVAVQKATASVAKKMGIDPKKLPPDVKSAIETATINALNIRTKAVIQRDADVAVKEVVLAGQAPIELLDDRMSVAQESLTHIVEDTKVEQVLNDTARLLWKKLNAFTNAGFNETQAFDLLLAEVEGRASRAK